MNKHIPISLVITNVAILIILIAVGFVGNESINTVREISPFFRQTCVIIDAGHGGIDGGAVSYSGVSESHFNLELSLRLNDLMNLLGIKTKMIRYEDVSVHTEGNTIAAKKVSDLRNRVDTVRNTKNAVYISIHQNHFPDERYYGTQVFYNGFNQSKEFAKQLQTRFVNTLNPSSTRKAKAAEGIFVLKNINCPGILVECGFLSNPQEEALLKDPKYQKLLCSVIATETVAFINIVMIVIVSMV